MQVDEAERPWYADSAANYHITPSLDNLSLQQPFKGIEAVTVGNGFNISIANIGSSTLLSNGSSSQLNHILHFLQASTNLLPIQKLCASNACYGEEHSNRSR